MAKELILIRHGHRDVANGRLQDNDLTEKGIAQAEAFSQTVGDALGKKRLRIVSSPKLRCLSTVAPIGSRLQQAPEILSQLDEQQGDETDEGFFRRIQTFTEDWKQSPEDIWVACSHGDWIPVFLDFLVGQEHHLRKGAWCHLSQNPDEILGFGPKETY